MKTSIKLCSILFLCLILFACSRDNEQIVIEETEIIPGETTVLADVYGVIIGPDEVPIPDVEITLSGRLAFSDENGVFKLEEVDISSEGSLVIGTKDGYYQTFKFTYAQEGQASYLQIEMVPKEVLTTFPSTEDIVAETNGGALISLPANIIRNLDGSVYSGEVRLSAHWYSPTSDNLAQTMPGDLRGRDSESNSVQLTTYGMMAVELESPQGEKLQLAEGQTARLSLPITVNIPEQTIPMWYFNESTGIWEEEGTAQHEGDFLVAEVPHFSFWNCDAPFDVVRFKGRLVTLDGLPISFQSVTITNNKNLTATGTTNIDGIFYGKIPSGIPLELVVEGCEEKIEIPIGPFANDEDLGDVVIDALKVRQVKANLIDCNSDPVQKGYMLIKQEGNVVVGFVDANGVIDFNFISCNDTGGEYFAYNQIDEQQSEIITFESSQGDIDELDFVVCGPGTGQFITFSINENSPKITFNDAEVTILDDTYIHILAESDTSDFYLTIMYLKDPGLSSSFRAKLFFSAPNENGITSTGFTGHGTPYLFEPNPVQDVGELVVGLRSSDFIIDFELFVDLRISSTKVRGEIWEDTNMDGLNDISEPRVAGKWVSSNSSKPNDIVWTIQADSNGKFVFDFLIPGREYQISYSAFNTDPIPTIPNVGSDETIDSDFIPHTPNRYRSFEFRAEDGLVIDTLDLGVLP